MATNECHQTLEEKELHILKSSIKVAQKKRGKKTIRNSNVKHIVEILESFLRDKKQVCYGGIAINNILPANERFYDFESEIPDYDFFSSNALRDVKRLADIFYMAGYESVEAKAGFHEGTFKLFVDNFQIADITHMDQKFFDKVVESAILKKGILYAPPNLLRMMSYNELSNPDGQVDRWSKVVERLTKLNKYHPINASGCGAVDFQRDFQRDFQGDKKDNETAKRDVYYNVRDALIEEEVVFFGGWACSLYGRYMPSNDRKKLEVELPDFDALSLDPYTTAFAVKNRLMKDGIKQVRIKKHSGVEEFVPDHYEITVGGNSVCFIFNNRHCYSYNIIQRHNRPVKIATIDTMLKFYLAFIYYDKKYFDVNRLLCMSQYLLNVQKENKLAQKGLLKRFTTDCYGNELTMGERRGEKNELYMKLRHNRNSAEYEKLFLRYIPRNNYSKDTKNACTRKKNRNRNSKKKKQKKNTRKKSMWNFL